MALSAEGILRTGQRSCYDEAGNGMPCRGSGQDGELRIGRKWPEPRFEINGDIADDLLTGLAWTVNANPAEFPMSWRESFGFVREMNRRAAFGFTDWRLPNRRELRSLLSYQAKRPALPEGHPFRQIFLGWYWTSTTAAIHPAYAWYVHMDGARMFYGRKTQDCLVWPVRGKSAVLPETGQHVCYDEEGNIMECPDGGQDGAGSTGQPWPEERFVAAGSAVLDKLTGLEWLRDASLSDAPVNWPEALELVRRLNAALAPEDKRWRMPNVNELESLVDCSEHSPALPRRHPFANVREVYWSATTSFYETDWAWALYLEKGALGVGVKKDRNFHVWPVRGD